MPENVRLHIERDKKCECGRIIHIDVHLDKKELAEAILDPEVLKRLRLMGVPNV